MTGIRFQKRRLKQQRRMARKAKRGKLPRAPMVVGVLRDLFSDSERESGPFLGREKMSETLEQFVAPLMPEDLTEQSFRSLLHLGKLAWNASFLPPIEAEQMIRETLDENLSSSPPHVRTDARYIVLKLMARKHAEFAEDIREIVDFEVQSTPTGLHLTVMSIMPTP